MRRFLVLIFFAIPMLLLPTLVKRFTYGFRVAKMQLDFPHRPEWDLPCAPGIRKILEQPFHFLGKGAQSYVFESEDGTSVVKLFRYDQPIIPAKVEALLSASKMAYEELREETGLIYIHLNETALDLPVLHCTDALGRKYRFPLDQYRFAVQKKAEKFRDTFQKAHASREEMRNRIDQFLSLLEKRVAKNIQNTDPSLSRNFGFLADRAIEFDFGNYCFCPTLNGSTEIRRYTSKLRRWLKKHDPEWVAYLDERVGALR